MTSPNDPQSPKEDMSWVHEEPTSIGERPPGLPPTPPAPPAPPPPAAAAAPATPRAAAPKPAGASKPEGAPNKVRGVFGKQSLPPPPAGRGPVAAPRPLDAKPELPTPPTLGAPELPAGINTMDDPIADLFANDGDAPQAQTIEMDADPPALPSTERDDPTLVPSGGADLFADADRAAEPAPVAKLGLAKTMLANTAAEEIFAHEPTRDPRSEDSIRPDTPRPSNLEGVVFDPDQSVARHLGEVAIDGQVGPAAVSDALADLPLPQVPMVTPSDAPIDSVPVRSMRSAFMIMALVLISGGVATLVSLGVLGGSPAEFRKKGTASNAAKVAPAATPVASPPSVATAPRAATPTVVPEPIAEPKPTPDPTAAEVVPVVAPPVAESPAAAAIEPAEPTRAAAPNGNAIENGNSPLPSGATDAALLPYQTALSADPRDHHAMEGLVKIYLARGQHREALGYAEQIVKRRPKRAAYRILHGQALLGVGDRAGARQAFQEALALEPDNRDAQRLLAQ